MNKPKVYFTKNISSQQVLELYDRVGFKLNGNVAIKIHSGEAGNQNFLRPEFWKPVVTYVGGAVVECNTAYEGARNSTDKHKQLMHDHGWDKYFNVDIMDAEGPDMELTINNGNAIKKNYVGKRMAEYDSMLVLSHFKGHPMGGYGGALKQLSIGCASSAGKAYIHSAGAVNDPDIVWNNHAEQDKFLEAMADAAKSVIDYFKGNIVYINIMKNLSVDCDCCAVAEDPCMKDIGMLASLDPVALDQACIDLVYSAADDAGRERFIERVESRNGIHTIEAAADIGCGNREYELINID
jgi:hypothetical protein